LHAEQSFAGSKKAKEMTGLEKKQGIIKTKTSRIRYSFSIDIWNEVRERTKKHQIIGWYPNIAREQTI